MHELFDVFDETSQCQSSDKTQRSSSLEVNTLDAMWNVITQFYHLIESKNLISTEPTANCKSFREYCEQTAYGWYGAKKKHAWTVINIKIEPISFNLFFYKKLENLLDAATQRKL